MVCLGGAHQAGVPCTQAFVTLCVGESGVALGSALLVSHALSERPGRIP